MYWRDVEFSLCNRVMHEYDRRVYSCRLTTWPNQSTDTPASCRSTPECLGPPTTTGSPRRTAARTSRQSRSPRRGPVFRNPAHRHRRGVSASGPRLVLHRHSVDLTSLRYF